MQRICLILIMFVALMNGRHGSMAPPASLSSFTLNARPLPLEPVSGAQAHGLHLSGAWQLTGTHAAFGGISSLVAREDGSFVALNDKGELFSLRIGAGANRAYVMPLPRFASEQARPRWQWDSESMQHDRKTGRFWVGFESIQRICRYSPDFVRIEGCVTPLDMRDWPATGGIESMVRFGDGRFLAISELKASAAGGLEALLWQGDPINAGTPAPVRLSYRPPAGYKPTDAVWLGGDKMLILNRRLTIAEGFTAKLVLVRLPVLREGATLSGEVVATLAPPRLADNFEALALGRDEGRPVLWMASDDNQLPIQRSLLLRFDLPPSWLSDAPAP